MTTDKGFKYYVLSPTLCEQSLSLPRGAAIIYPKDAAYILQFGDIRPNQKILECGLGSGALTLNLLNVLGDLGVLYSIEKREDFFKTGLENVNSVFPNANNWQCLNVELSKFLENNTVTFDRIILDMLDPWLYIEKVSKHMQIGGILIIYVTTVPQIMEVSNTFESLAKIRREDESHPMFINIECVENIRRPWKLDKLSVRPEHHGIMHSGFIITARLV